MSSYSQATRKELRNTGLVVGIAFGVLAVLQILLHGKLSKPPGPAILFAVSGVLILLGLLAPALLRPFHFLWMKLSLALGYVMNRVILGLLFFIFLTPGAILLRVFGRDLMHRRFNRRAESYWVHRTEAPVAPERYERQF